MVIFNFKTTKTEILFLYVVSSQGFKASSFPNSTLRTYKDLKGKSIKTANYSQIYFSFQIQFLKR